MPALCSSHSGLAGVMVMVYTVAEFSAAVLCFFDSLPHMPSSLEGEPEACAGSYALGGDQSPSPFLWDISQRLLFVFLLARKMITI